MKKANRGYNMSVRAASSAKTESNILKTIGELWLKHSIHEITLKMIASETGITERTILRKFGSKENLFEIAIKNDTAGIQSIKDETETGNIEHAVQTLMKEYEVFGMAVIRTLAVEHEFPIAAILLEKGRQSHKAWCARVFEPYLPDVGQKEYNMILGSLYAATDVNTWKLLRKDLGYSKKDTASILQFTIGSIIKSINK